MRSPNPTKRSTAATYTARACSPSSACGCGRRPTSCPKGPELTAEQLSVILGKGEPLIGRLLLYDALEQKFREVKYARDPQCPACGDQPMKELLPEYTEASCAVAPRRATA